MDCIWIWIHSDIGGCSSNHSWGFVKPWCLDSHGMGWIPRGLFPELLLEIHWNPTSSSDKMIYSQGSSRSDSLLLSPYHWAKLFGGVVAIVAVPMRFAVICWIVLEAFVGQIHVFPLCSWMTIQVFGLSRISFWKSYREAVRLEKVQVSHHHNF